MLDIVDGTCGVEYHLPSLSTWNKKRALSYSPRPFPPQWWKNSGTVIQSFSCKWKCHQLCSLALNDCAAYLFISASQRVPVSAIYSTKQSTWSAAWVWKKIYISGAHQVGDTVTCWKIWDTRELTVWEILFMIIANLVFKTERHGKAFQALIQYNMFA